MGFLSPLHDKGLRGFATALGITLAATVGPSDEVQAASAAPGFVIHGPEETLRDFCFEEEGELWFLAPGGARFELITSTCDPSIVNRGDGSFHPFSESIVREALASVRYRVQGVAAQVFLLPYPRRLVHSSAAASQLILLSPGVLPLSEEQQHAALAHELGHVVQYALMPDHATEPWARYRSLRGIADETRFHAAASHADRPHEIFAEDFRALFGGTLANYSGTIENASLAHPSQVHGLAAFLTSLAADPVAEGGSLRGFPNPSRGALSFRRLGGPAEPLDLYDLAGRRLVSLDPTPLADGWQWRWDGRHPQGLPAGAGIVFARIRDSAEPAVRISLVR